MLGFSSASCWSIASPPVRRECLVRLANLRKYCADVIMGNGHFALKLCHGGVVGGQLLSGLQCMSERLEPRLVLAGLHLQQPDIVVDARQQSPEIGDGGVVRGELSVDPERLTEGLQRRGRLAHLPEEEAKVIVRESQIAPEFGDGGVVLDELLIHHERLPIRRERRRRHASLPLNDARLTRLLAMSFRNSKSAGCSSTSRVRVSSQLWRADRASDFFPVSSRTIPMPRSHTAEQGETPVGTRPGWGRPSSRPRASFNRARASADGRSR